MIFRQEGPQVAVVGPDNKVHLHPIVIGKDYGTALEVLGGVTVQDRIIINPAGYSFTSIAILDALKMFAGPIIELHITNIHRREDHYHHSYVSKVATAVIAGLGPKGYGVAVQAMCDMLG